MENRIKYGFQEVIDRIRRQNSSGARLSFDRGGRVDGSPHSRGGTPFVLADTGVHIEEERNEINIPGDLLLKDEIFEFRNMTNYEVLDEILGLAKLSLNSKVTEVRSGDVVICVRSAWASAKRNHKGTIKSILNNINTSGGCASFKEGGDVASGNSQKKLSQHYKKQ